MATGNFWNHKNGIYVICNYDFDEVKECILEDSEYTEKEISDQDVYEEMNFLEREEFENFLSNFGDYIKDHYDFHMVKDYTATVYNKSGKLVAELSLHSGYYSAAQVIVETDFDELSERYLDYDYEYDRYLKTEYSPNHKRLLKMLAHYTTPIVCQGYFSNGEAVYQKVG